MPPRTILVVDDDDDLRLALSLRLRAAGYRTAFAADAVTSLAVARREQPDLILLDLGLPAGGGYVVLERLQRLPDLSLVPVVVLTARDRDSEEERAREAGALGFFEKPFDHAELLQFIASILQPDGEAEVRRVPVGAGRPEGER